MPGWCHSGEVARTLSPLAQCVGADPAAHRHRGSCHMGWFSKSTDGFFLSTTTPAGIELSQYLGVVNGEAIIGANIFRDMFSSVRDVVGGRAGGYERALSGARDAAMEEMIDAAKALGANGVIGIDFDYEVLGETNGMMMVAVSGTAIKVG
jgi:uncharacterized protein YbjQ (UPF0145 family)